MNNQPNSEEHKYYGSTRQVFYKSMSGNGIEVNGREVQGYLAAFGNRDMDGDVILEGAFTKSLNDRGPQSTTPRKIAYLYDHDFKSPVGVFTDLWQDSKGLAFKGILDPTDLGERLAIQYKTGSINNHSIGHKYMWDKIEVTKDTKGEKTFYLKEVNLFEGSATPLGINENTPYTGKKSIELIGDAAILNKETDTFLRSLSAENEYIARQIITKHIALAETKPLAALKEEVEPQINIIESINKLKLF